MATICYAWNDAPFAWIDAPFTWAEACIIEKIVGGVVAAGRDTYKKTKERLEKLNKDEQETLIGLFVRLEVDEIVFEKKVNKNKNTKVKIKLKDIEIAIAQERYIKVNVKINED